MDSFIKVDGVSFNATQVQKMSLQQFMTHEMHTNHFKHLDKKAKNKTLFTVYKIITGVLTKDV